MDEKNAVATGGTRYDGYMNVLNRFGTAQDNGEAYHFAPETMVDDMTLAAHYEGNGLFTKIIDIPAEKAATREFDLGLSDEDVKSLVTDALEDLDWVATASQAIKWSRLFGGAIAVMLIDDGGRLEDPVNWNAIKGIDEIDLFERAIVEPDYSYLYSYGRPQGTKRFRPKFGKPQFFRVYSQYGHFVVHESRCLTFRNGILPETTTQAEYRYWGVPEYARIKRALRETVTNHANGTKLLERSVQGIYKMNGLTSTLSVEGGDEEVLRRLRTIDMARGILNSIVIDGDGEEYTFQTFQLSGFGEAINVSCNMLSAVTNIPQTILFGRSPAGENSTGEADLENWYNYLGQISDLQIKGNLQRLLDILFRGWLNTKQLHEEPKYKLEFKPFWNLSEMEQADLDQKKANTEHIRAQTAKMYCDMQAVDPSEIRKGLAKSEQFDIEELLDESDTGGDAMAELKEALVGLPPPRKGNSDRYDESGIDWITVNGARVPLDDNGVVSSGGQPSLAGKNFSRAVSQKSNSGGPSRTKPHKFEELPIKASRLHPDITYERFGGELSEESGAEIRTALQKVQGTASPVVKTIPIDSLSSDQVTNKMADLKRMCEVAPTLEQLETLSSQRPVVAKYKGDTLLIDGYTRTILTKAYGSSSIEADYYDLDKILSRNDEVDVVPYDGAASSVGVIVVKDEGVLCGIRMGDTGNGKICGPGGHVEDVETPRQAAMRETMEEFGIMPRNLMPFGQGPMEADTGLAPQLFLCTEYDGRPRCTDHEMECPMFIPLDTLLEDEDGQLFKPFADSLAILKELLDADGGDTS